MPLALAAWLPACSDETPAGGPTSTTAATSTGNGGAGGAGGTAAGGTTGSGAATGTGGDGGGTGEGGTGGSGGSMAGTKANCSAPGGPTGKVKLTEVLGGLASPILITSPWGDDDRQLVVEQPGRVRLLKGGVATTFLDITAKTDGSGERGLLGLAFHPGYGQNGRFFVHYTDNSGDTVIEEYRRAPGDPDAADPNPVGAPLLQADQPAANHNGGSIAFSPFDGMLYIGLGDGGGSGDTYKNGQNKATLLGALLRIDVAQNPYTIPAGNIGDGAPEIWDWGLRNPYRFSFDVCGGDLYIGDVGQGQWEEIDIAAAGDGNKNWGWNIAEGSHCFGGGGCDMSGLAPPAAEYSHGGGNCSVTGGVVYRGSAIPWLRGAYLYGDYCTSRIWMLRWAGGVVSDQQELSSQLSLPGYGVTSFGLDNHGEVYITHHGGKVYRLDPAP